MKLLTFLRTVGRCAVVVQLDLSNAINTAAGKPKVAVGTVHHVAHDTSARRDDPGLELLPLGVKTHDRIRLHPRFAVPHDVVHDVDAVRLGSGPTGRRPLAAFAGLGVESAKIAAGEVPVPDNVIRRDGYTPGTGVRIRQNVFTNLERRGIDPGQFVGVEFAEEGNAFRIDYHAVGLRPRRGHPEELHFARLR